MTERSYEWEEGAELKDHTKKKHAILGEYFREYLITRCQLPQREKFRLAVVDGFAGGGLYKCGTYGSPILFVDTLVKTTNEINIRRATQSLRPIEIECLLILNDRKRDVLELLKANLTPHLAGAPTAAPNLRLFVEYHNESFETLYPTVKARIKQAKCSNVFFNLDQCGYTHATAPLLRDIMTSWQKAEILLTFMIASLLAYLSPDKDKTGAQLEPAIREKIDAIRRDQGLLQKQLWLGECEKIVFDHLRSCAPYVSPFSIANPDGWKYWLMHFANSYRARQVYNNILHADGLAQAHFGRFGLNMLAYDAQAGGGQLYIFDTNSRIQAIESLNQDIPRFIAESGDMMSVEEFYAAAYSETPAHSDDIHKSIIENPEIEVITPNGGKRREASAIDVGDTLKLKSQRSILFGFK